MSTREYGDDDAEKAKRGDVDAFLRLALKRFTISAEAEAKLRSDMLDDKRFFAGEHWDPRQKKEREEAVLPCLTIDRIKQPKRQITNGLMAARPGIQISPVDSGADLATAAAIQGLCRNVESQSHADVVYATAANDAVVCGRGFWRINTPYEYDDQPDERDPEGYFQQGIRMERVRNPFTVYPDPACKEIDYRDARFYHVLEDVPIDDYRERYPDSKACDAANWQGIGDDLPEWINERTIRISEYWYVEIVPTTMALLEVPQPPHPETGEPQPAVLVVMEKKKGRPWAAGVKELDTRPAMLRRVKVATINALEVLAGNDQKTGGRDWAGRWIPIVPCLGEEFDIGGRVDLRGIVRDAKDQSRVYDYQASALVEQMMLASKAPWIMAQGQDEGFEAQWDNANTRRQSRLIYVPISAAGTLVGAPQRNNFEPAIQAIVVGMQQSEAQIMATTGFHEPSLGQQGPQESGRAIMARTRQGEIGSSNYAVNLSHAIRFGGEIIVDLIPHILPAPRVIRILGPDDQEQKVAFHNGASESDLASLQQQGIAKIYDVSTGRYDVVVGTGISKDTQRQEQAETMTALVQAQPALMQTHADLFFESLDTPVARKMAERSKKLLPPHLQDQGDGKNADPQQLQAQIAQMQQQMQQMQQAGQQLQQALQTKQVEVQGKLEAETQRTQAEIQSNERLAKLEADVRIRVAEINANTDLIETKAKLDGQKTLEILKAELAQLGERIGFARSEHVASRTDARVDAKEQRDRDAAAAETAEAE